MNEQIAQTAMAAIDKVATEMTTAQKEHFAQVLTWLVGCYGKAPKSRAVLVMSDDESLHTVAINATEDEAAGLLAYLFAHLDPRFLERAGEDKAVH